MIKALVVIALLAGAAPAIAQKASPRPTPQQVKKFVADFQSGILKGCLGNQPKGALKTTASSYCSCYAKSFIDRYSPIELAEMSNLASKNPQSAYTINLMMRPEARTCGVSQPPPFQ